MITDDLLSYIQTQLKKNTPQDLIFSRLAQAGWHMDDIEEGWRTATTLLLKEKADKAAEDAKNQSSQKETSDVVLEKKADPYREIPDTSFSDKIAPLMTTPLQKAAPVVTETKMWTPTTPQVVEKVTVPVQAQVVAPIITPVASTPALQTPLVVAPSVTVAQQPLEIKTSVTEKSAVIEKPIEEKAAQITVEQNIATPSVSTTPIAQVAPTISTTAPVTAPIQTTTPLQAPITPSLPKISIAQMQPTAEVKIAEEKPKEITEKKIEQPAPVVAQPIAQVATIAALNVFPDSSVGSSTNTPLVASTIAPVVATPVNTNPTVNPQATSSAPQSSIPLSPSMEEALEHRNSVSDMFSNKAMLASYPVDVSVVNKGEEVTTTSRSKISWKAIALIIVVLIACGGIFAFVYGYIKVPMLVKEKPTNALLAAHADFDSLRSYKTETNMTLTFPSLANITTGLVNGESVKSKDTETITLNALGLVKNKKGSVPTIIEYAATIKSTLLHEDLVSNIKYDGTTSYVVVPDLGELFGQGAPTPTTVAINNGELATIIPELPQKIQDIIHRIDMYNILSKGMPSNTKNKMKSDITEFIKNVNVTESEQEDIKGIGTYHYKITADHQTTKKMLGELAALFIAPENDQQKKDLDEGVGSVNFDSFDVWVGRDDGMVHQYQFTVTAPLSKMIALDDSGIAGKQVSLTWKKTYYDFDAFNSIVLPETYITANDLAKNLKDIKIKNSVSSFGETAKRLSNAEGHFGKAANAAGSCVSPIAGSLFSPVGHTKGAITQVSSIATTMQTLLGATEDVGSCYSTPSSWAFAFPLASNPQSYYCSDSTGTLTTLPQAITGPSCK